MDTPTTESTETPKYSLLAQKHFGAGYTGEAQEAPHEETQEAVQEVTEEPAEIEQEEPETQEAAEETSEETLESQESDEEEVVSSFDDLIQTQEWDPEWAESITVKVKVDGEEKPVKLSDLRNNYQMQEAAQKRLEEAKSIRESAKQEIEQSREKIETTFRELAANVKVLDEMLLAEEKNTNFDELKRLDPAEYSAKKLDLQEKRQTIDAKKREILASYQKAITQNQEEAQQALKERLAQESQLLIERIPEWADEERAKTEQNMVTTYLKKAGFADEEIAQVYDHRFVDLARKAMLYEEKLESLEPAKKKLKKVVKTIPPGSKKTASQTNAQRQNALRSKLKKTGSLDDAAALLGIKR